MPGATRYAYGGPARLVNGSDVDFRARAARGHSAAGPVRRACSIGPIWLWILAAACLYLGWQLLTLYRLDRWLRLRSQIDPPNLGGIWGDIVAQVVRLHRRKQFHKQRLVQLFRELRRSTAALPDGVIILSTAARDRLVQPPGGAAARPADGRWMWACESTI